MIRKILIILSFQVLIVANSLIDFDLVRFVNIISVENDMTILIDEKIDKNFTLFIDSKISKDTYKLIFIDILKSNNLKLKVKNNYYKIIKDTKQDLIIKSIQLKNIEFEEIKELTTLYPKSNFKYLSKNNMLLIQSTLKKYNEIAKFIKIADIYSKQYKIKITIIDTNLNKIRDYGISYINENIVSNDNDYLFNLIAYPFTSSASYGDIASSKLSSMIQLLNEDKITDLISSPILTIYNNKKSKFEVVKNIPYLESTTTIDENQTKTTQSYKYKDVGLKIDLLPKIYDYKVFIDLNLVIENLVTTGETPITSKISINQYFNLEHNKLFILSGINQKQSFKTSSGIPLLKDIPILGWLFKSDNKTITNSNLTIIFELIDNKAKKIFEPLPLKEINIQDINSLRHSEVLKDVFGL